MSAADGVREHLQNRLRVVEFQLDEIERILRQPEDADLEEQALERDDDEVLECLARSVGEEIVAIQLALERISNGVYGQCKNCGRRIGVRRLRAIPQTTTCLRCARIAI